MEPRSPSTLFFPGPKIQYGNFRSHYGTFNGSSEIIDMYTPPPFLSIVLATPPSFKQENLAGAFSENDDERMMWDEKFRE